MAMSAEQKDKVNKSMPPPSAQFCIIDVDNLQAWTLFILEQLKEHTHKIVFQKQEFCGSTWVYRGQSDASWQITSSFERAIDFDCTLIRNAERTLRGKELSAISRFKAKAWPYVDKPNMSNLEWLMLMRHHGVPTRLVDFTENPIVALFFALEDNPSGDFAIWALNKDAMEDVYTQSQIGKQFPEFKQLYAKYGPRFADALNDLNSQDPLVIKVQNHSEKFALSDATVEMRNEINRKLATSIFDTPLYKEPSYPSGVGAIWFYPELPSSRMKAQNGLFIMPFDIEKSFMQSLCASLGIAMPEPITELSHLNISDTDNSSCQLANVKLIKFVFKHELIQEAQNLVLLSNCSRENLFPDIEGVAAAVKEQIEQSLSGHMVLHGLNLGTN